MNKKILALVAVLSLAAASAQAAGLNLFVNGCNADFVPSGAINNPCTSNTGSMQMVASYVAPAGISALSGIEVVVDVQVASAALTPWWDVNTGGCRQNALSASYNYIGISNPSCEDAWQGATVFGGLAAFRAGEGAPNRGRMIIGWAVAPNNVRPLTADLEYYASNVGISRANSTGSTCPGCADPACLVLNSILLAQPVGTPGGDQIVAAPAAGNFIAYNGGSVVGGCPAAVPTQNKTWGAVKSLYR